MLRTRLRAAIGILLAAVSIAAAAAPASADTNSGNGGHAPHACTIQGPDGPIAFPSGSTLTVNGTDPGGHAYTLNFVCDDGTWKRTQHPGTTARPIHVQVTGWLLIDSAGTTFRITSTSVDPQVYTAR